MKALLASDRRWLALWMEKAPGINLEVLIRHRQAMNDSSLSALLNERLNRTQVGPSGVHRQHTCSSRASC